MRYLVISLALAIAGIGCSKDSKSESATGDAAQEAMSHYAKGFNALLEDPKKMVSEYFKEFPEAPDGKAKGRPNLFPRHTHAERSITEAKEAFKAAKAAAPASMAALAAPADKALAAIDKVKTTFADAYKYYDAQDYKDDGYAKAKQLHQDMQAASKDFEGAIDELQSGLSAIEDQQAVAELAKFDPKTYSYWFRYFNQQAKQFLNKVEAGGELDAAFAPVDKALNDMNAFVATKSSSDNVFGSYVDSATRYHATGKKLLRALKEGGKDKSNEAERLSGELVQGYNGLITSTRALYSMEANNLLK